MVDNLKEITVPTTAAAGVLDGADFDLAKTMECGQVFGWARTGGGFYGVIAGKPAGLRQAGSKVHFRGEVGLTREEVVRFLGLDEDLPAILASITRDDFVRQAVLAAYGLRLVKQEPWACLCSYILSANNRVDRIDKLVKEISRRFGTVSLLDGTPVYGLPGPAAMAGCAESGFRACGVGFRAPYLVRAAEMVAAGIIDFARLDLMPYTEAKKVLKTIPGVGDKVADCVLLFALSKYEAFPVDVWIKRVMERVYFGGADVEPARISTFGREYFGRYAGYAQEYIYFYARNCLGK
jgi:N-glycosylase/DNA lyase